MRPLRIAILSAEEARQIRLEAEAVLRSASRRLTCDCARPCRGDIGECVWCGKWISDLRVIKALRRCIDDMDEIQERQAAAERRRIAEQQLETERTYMHLDVSYGEASAA